MSVDRLGYPGRRYDGLAVDALGARNVDASFVSLAPFNEPLIEGVVERISPDLNFKKLGKNILWFADTKAIQLPKACANQGRDILMGLLKTTFLVSLVAGRALAMPFLLGSFLGGVVWHIVSVTVMVFGKLAAHQIAFPGHRLQEDEPHKPWFYPSIETLSTRSIFVDSLLWLALAPGATVGWVSPMGVILAVLPLFEACTRKRRWENIFSRQGHYLEEAIRASCTFYRQHGGQLFHRIEQSIQFLQTENVRRVWRAAMLYMHRQNEFLRHFDPAIPPLVMLVDQSTQAAPAA